MTYSGIGTDSIVGCFNWTPTLADTGLHIITITATDSTCAPPGILISQTFTMALDVHQSFPMTVTSVNPACGINNGTITANSPGASNLFITTFKYNQYQRTVYGFRFWCLYCLSLKWRCLCFPANSKFTTTNYNDLVKCYPCKPSLFSSW